MILLSYVIPYYTIIPRAQGFAGLRTWLPPRPSKPSRAWTPAKGRVKGLRVWGCEAVEALALRASGLFRASCFKVLGFQATGLRCSRTPQAASPLHFVREWALQTEEAACSHVKCCDAQQQAKKHHGFESMRYLIRESLPGPCVPKVLTPCWEPEGSMTASNMALSSQVWGLPLVSVVVPCLGFII